MNILCPKWKYTCRISPHPRPSLGLDIRYWMSISRGVFIYILIRRPLQSVERVRRKTSKSSVPFKTLSQTARPSNPKQPVISPGRDDSCLQQPRLDGAKSDQLFFYRGHSSLQTRFNPDATRLFRPANPRAPHAPFCPPGPSN